MFSPGHAIAPLGIAMIEEDPSPRPIVAAMDAQLGETLSALQTGMHDIQRDFALNRQRQD